MKTYDEILADLRQRAAAENRTTEGYCQEVIGCDTIQEAMIEIQNAEKTGPPQPPDELDVIDLLRVQNRELRHALEWAESLLADQLEPDNIIRRALARTEGKR